MMRVILLVVFLAHCSSAQIQVDDFISNFESGNVANVQRVGADSFTFSIMLDDDQGDTFGWFYFAITGNQGRVVTLFLTNPDSWQNETCSPVISLNNVNWNRAMDIWRFGSYIGFQVMLGSDTVWFAQDFPFTASRMYAILDTLAQLPYVSRRTLGYSVHGRPIDAVEITDTFWPAGHKKKAWLISRQHPMETPPSFMLLGMFERIMADSDFGRRFRRDIDLHVIPIVNVDGVVEGYSRHNVNGVNLNRDWGPIPDEEEPEVRAVHGAIDSLIAAGNPIDMFMDIHAAPDNYDFGFRMSQAYTDPAYFNNQESFLWLLETFDPWQSRSRWRDLDTLYAFGVSCVALYDQYSMDTYSSETPWTRRENGDFITIQSLHQQGGYWAEAIYDYLYPLTVYGIGDSVIENIVPGESFIPRVWDFDQRYRASLTVTAFCIESADSESVTLVRQNSDGLFSASNPVATDQGLAVPGDGVISLVLGGTLEVVYIDPDLPSRIFPRYLTIGPACNYIPGDVNNDGIANGIDVTYGVSFFKGGSIPPVACDMCPQTAPFYASGDVNGNCNFNGIDITFFVSYLKGGPALQYCPDCPPAGLTNPPIPAVEPIGTPILKPKGVIKIQD